MIYLLVIAISFAVAVLLVCVYYMTQCGSLRSERDRLQADLAAARSANDALQTENHRLGTEIAVVHEAQGQIEKRVAQVQAQSREAFAALAGDALRQSTEQFLQLAQQKLKSEHAESDKQLELRKKEIEGLVAPIQEQLTRYQQSLAAIETARGEAYTALRTQLTLFAADQQRLRAETGNLVQALHRPDVRGRWGEMQLKRVAELAGMSDHCRCDFALQQTQTSDSGALRPDMTVFLPGGRTIIVDAKTPIDAYLSSLDAPEGEARRKLLEQHADQVEAKVRDLSGKQYWAHQQRSPEFVVLFIPGESFLYAAVSVRPDLIERAMEKQVIIATPSTLIALLKTVAQGWREQQIAENAQRISELGRELHERLATAVEHVQKLGAALGKAVDHYNTFVGSFESRVVASARKFEEMGAKSKAALPVELPRVEMATRELKALDDPRPQTATPRSG
jgi:DNA recombination protein RmuC